MRRGAESKSCLFLEGVDLVKSLAGLQLAPSIVRYQAIALDFDKHCQTHSR
jgi:hypothetical protein